VPLFPSGHSLIEEFLLMKCGECEWDEEDACDTSFQIEHDDKIHHQVEEAGQYGTEHVYGKIHRMIAPALHLGDAFSGYAPLPSR